MTRVDHRSPRRRCTERREEKRLLCSDLVRLRWGSEGGKRGEEVVVLEDLSNSGASVLAGVPIEVGSPVTLTAGGRTLKGETRYCREVPNGYLIGVQLSVESQADAAGWRGYRPEHLLDITRLDFTPEE